MKAGLEDVGLCGGDRKWWRRSFGCVRPVVEVVPPVAGNGNTMVATRVLPFWCRREKESDEKRKDSGKSARVLCILFFFLSFSRCQHPFVGRMMGIHWILMRDLPFLSFSPPL